MNAITLAEAEAARIAYAEVSAAWDAYRRSQEIPWPAAGGVEVLKTQSRLWHLIESPACRGSVPDLDAIREARADLAAKVRRYCGDAAGEYVSGEARSVAA